VIALQSLPLCSIFCRQERNMASLTIRNLDDPLKAKLRIRAAEHGHSMEEEARGILRSALSTERSAAENPFLEMHRRFAALGGVELPELTRAPGRAPPDFRE
jgi:plasmid stability protein